MKRIISLVVFTLSMIFLTGLEYNIGSIYALNTKETGYQLTPWQAIDITLADTSCRRITNNATNRFIPTRTMAEWNSFNAVAASQGVTVGSCGVNGACGSLPGLVPMQPSVVAASPSCTPWNYDWNCSAGGPGTLTRCYSLYNSAVTTIPVLNDVYGYCGQQTGYTPSNMCAAGDLSLVTGDYWSVTGVPTNPLPASFTAPMSPLTWICLGRNGGTNSPICNTNSAPAPQCGSVYRTCNVGTASDQRDLSWCNGNWTWTCANLDKTVLCRASSGCKYLQAPVYQGTSGGGCRTPAVWLYPLCGTPSTGQPCQGDKSYSVYATATTTYNYKQTCQ